MSDVYRNMLLDHIVNADQLRGAVQYSLMMIIIVIVLLCLAQILITMNYNAELKLLKKRIDCLQKKG